MDMNIIFDVFIILSGLFLIYCAYEMRTSAQVPKALINQSIDLNRAPDAKGFIQYMFLKTMIIGIVATLCGCFSIYNTYFGKGYDTAQLIALAIYFVILVWYGILITKAQKKFLKDK